ncbi:hypothetical protein, partial [Pantoea ananatis]|uniref:hypothetical protein n=1 Tax=Pantoea ananas TaxID=553 RepID=UPI001B3070C9
SYRKERPLSGVFFSAPLTSKNKYKKMEPQSNGRNGHYFPWVLICTRMGIFVQILLNLNRSSFLINLN